MNGHEGELDLKGVQGIILGERQHGVVAAGMKLWTKKMRYISSKDKIDVQYD
jgi:hypothetical protein